MTEEVKDMLDLYQKHQSHPWHERPGDHVAADEDALRRCLAPLFPGIVAIQREPSRAVTSYICEALTLELATGGKQRVFLKDFGFSQLPKDDLPLRRERELRVYRDLLDKLNRLESATLGTARFYGALWDAPKSRFWLFLEFVDARELRSCEFDDWVRAAGWLGRMQGYLGRHAELLKGCDFLLRHDAEFFWSKARLALEAVSRVSSALARRFGKSLEDYDRLVGVMTSQPQTLVHGSYRPQNILVGPQRIIPIDWELAALGAPLYDFGFLSDGFRPPELDILWDAYQLGAEEWGVSTPARAEMSHVVDSFRLVKILKSLGDSVGFRFKEATVVKLVGMAEETARGLGR